jgi:hypothetical protein
MGRVEPRLVSVVLPQHDGGVEGEYRTANLSAAVATSKAKMQRQHGPGTLERVKAVRTTSR